MQKQKLEIKAARLRGYIDYCTRKRVEPRKGHLEKKKQELREIESKLKSIK